MRSHLAFPGRKPEPSSNSATRLHLPFVKLCLTFPSLETGRHPAPRDKGPAFLVPRDGPELPPNIPIPSLETPDRFRSLETHKPGMGEGKRNGLGLFCGCCFLFFCGFFFSHKRLFGVEIKG